MVKKSRSEIMSAVPQQNTSAEVLIRKVLYSKGYRYRVNYKDLPGRPDIVFLSRKKVIFVHGCFWHRHGCKKSTTPKTRIDFWMDKFEKNVERDKRVEEKLKAMGWSVFVIWECELKNLESSLCSVENFLNG